jgi:2-methylisocitrate lyase-like PEP mutase family enzyme
MTMADRFRELHAEGFFVMPNPWDQGSARALQEMGFPALATTSAGFAHSLGKADQEVTRDELVAHVADLTAVIDVPLNVDSERLYPDDPGGIDETVRLLADAGAAGCSIEDYVPARRAIVPVEEATEAVAVAAAACARHGLVLTARAENHLYGHDDLDDTISRLVAYRDAGASVLYAPLLASVDDIGRVVREVDAPLNVLGVPGTPPVAELRSLGVRRMSTGGWLQSIAYDAMRRTAATYLD